MTPLLDLGSKALSDLPDSAFAFIEPSAKLGPDGRSLPRSARHFPIGTAAHVRDSLARIAMGAQFGKQALPAVQAAARHFRLFEEIGGIDSEPPERSGALVDHYRQAAAEQLGAWFRAGELAVDAKRWDQQYRERRQAAIAQVETNAEIRRMGGSPAPLPEEILRLAATPSAAASVEQILSTRQEARRQALREALTPVTGQHDGSHVEEVGPGSFAGAVTRFGQIQRHQQLARAGSAPAGNYLDAHRSTRRIREELYRRLGAASR